MDVVSSPQDDAQERKELEPLSTSILHTHLAFLSAKTGTTGVALRLHASSHIFASSVTPIATPARSALMDDQPVQVGTIALRTWGSPFRKTALQRTRP